MTWRINTNESNYSDSELIAWNFVLPEKHLPIIDEDRAQVKKVKAFLESTFSKQAMSSAVKKLNLKQV